LVALYGGGGAGRLTLKPIYDAHVFSLATVAGATSIAVLSFLGFDGISTLPPYCLYYWWEHSSCCRRGSPRT
jgi:hypothetical protein